MKRLIFLTLVQWIIISSCYVPLKYSIDFCTNLNSDIECEPSKSDFKTGDRVYILLECNQPFTENIVAGIFYYIEKNEKIPSGKQEWKINSGDSYTYDYVDFSEKGIYEFEFLNEKGMVLANKRLEIK